MKGTFEINGDEIILTIDEICSKKEIEQSIFNAKNSGINPIDKMVNIIKNASKTPNGRRERIQ